MSRRSTVMGSAAFVIFRTIWSLLDECLTDDLAGAVSGDDGLARGPHRAVANGVGGLVDDLGVEAAEDRLSRFRFVAFEVAKAHGLIAERCGEDERGHRSLSSSVVRGRALMLRKAPTAGSAQRPLGRARRRLSLRASRWP